MNSLELLSKFTIKKKPIISPKTKVPSQENNFDYIAITDHDTVEAIDEIKELDTSVNFIIGVEMSCKYASEDIHILGYFGSDVSEYVLKKRVKKELLDVRKLLII